MRTRSLQAAMMAFTAALPTLGFRNRRFLTVAALGWLTVSATPRAEHFEPFAVAPRLKQAGNLFEFYFLSTAVTRDGDAK